MRSSQIDSKWSREMVKSTLVVTCAVILSLSVGNPVEAQSHIKIDPATSLQWYVSQIMHPNYIEPQHREFACAGGRIEVNYSSPWDSYSITQVTPSTAAVKYGACTLVNNLFTNVVESSPTDTTPWTGNEWYTKITAKFHGFTVRIPVSYFIHGQWTPEDPQDDGHWTGFHTRIDQFHIDELVP
jgi:hypothetical protein